jgi:hypothetical protein
MAAGSVQREGFPRWGGNGASIRPRALRGRFSALRKDMAGPVTTTRSFAIELSVFPAIPLLPAKALALAANLSAANVSLTDIHLSDESWDYRRPTASEGQPYGQIKVTVQEDKIRIEHRFPATGLEFFERLVQAVTGALEKAEIAPQLALVGVELDYIVDLKHDARFALLEGLGLHSQDDDQPPKIACFDRPCHLVGLRLGFPPYIIKKEATKEPSAGDDAASDDEGAIEDQEESAGQDADDDTETQVDSAAATELGESWTAIVTVTTLEDDPTKASIEVDGRWMAPVRWKKIDKEIVERLNTTEKFLKEKAAPFLGHFTAKDDDEHAE